MVQPRCFFSSPSFSVLSFIFSSGPFCMFIFLFSTPFFSFSFLHFLLNPSLFPFQLLFLFLFYFFSFSVLFSRSFEFIFTARLCCLDFNIHLFIFFFLRSDSLSFLVFCPFLMQSLNFLVLIKELFNVLSSCGSQQNKTRERSCGSRLTEHEGRTLLHLWR